MSFDVFVQCYGAGQRSGLSREHVRSLFPVSDRLSDEKRWVLKYSEDDGADNCDSDIYVGTEEPLLHFSVSRPGGSIRLWDALLTILKMGSVVMFWPGSPPLLARKSEVEPLPKEIIDIFGEPVFVDRAEEFFVLLKRT